MFLIKIPRIVQPRNASSINSARNVSNIKPVKLVYKVFNEEPPPLIIFHGLYGSKTNFNTTARTLHRHTIPRRKVYSADVRNHGHSPHSKYHTYDHLAADIKQLLGDLGYTKASLLGHSMGGKAVMCFAIRHPEMVDKLIISDISHASSIGIDQIKGVLTDMKNVKMPPANLPLTKGMKVVDKRLAEEMTNDWFRHFLLTNLRKDKDGRFYWRLNVDALLENVNAIAGFPDVSKIVYKGPVLFLIGDQSNYVERSDIPEMKRLCPNSEIKYVSDAGHLIHIDNPEEFAQVCLEFLNRKT